MKSFAKIKIPTPPFHTNQLYRDVLRITFTDFRFGLENNSVTLTGLWHSHGIISITLCCTKQITCNTYMHTYVCAIIGYRPSWVRHKLVLINSEIPAKVLLILKQTFLWIGLSTYERVILLFDNQICNLKPHSQW